MALKRTTKVAGDYLDLKDLAQNEPTLVLFRLVSFEPPEKGDYGLLVPVIADALICSGADKGKVWPAQRFFGAPTKELRGVPNPAKGDRTAEPPVHSIGDELPFRVEYRAPRGAQPFAALQIPSEPEYTAIEEVHADGKGWDGTAAPTANGAADGKTPW